MGYSNFLFLKEELSLIAVMLILLVYDLFGSQKSLKYFHPVACVLFLAHTLLNLFPAGTAEAFGGMYVCTPIGSIVKTILNTGTLIVLLQAYNWVNSESVLIRRGEFYLILFSSLLGMYFMISAGNFLLFFIGLETASIPMAVLSAFDKYKHQSAEAGAKYILSATFASGLSLYGISLIYGTVGTLYFADIPAGISGNPLQYMAFGFFIVGLFFKISLVPFHQWTPDVYEGAPTTVTSYFSVISKGSAAFVLMTLLFKVFGNLVTEWQAILYRNHHRSQPVCHPPAEFEAFSGLFFGFTSRIYYAGSDQRERYRDDVTGILYPGVYDLQPGCFRGDRHHRKPDRQDHDRRLQRSVFHESEVKYRHDAGFILFSRDSSVCRFFQ